MPRGKKKVKVKIKRRKQERRRSKVELRSALPGVGLASSVIASSAGVAQLGSVGGSTGAALGAIAGGLIGVVLWRTVNYE